MSTTPKFIWIQNGLLYKQVESSIKLIDQLPSKIYNVCANPKTGEIYLEEFADEFTFGFKLYGLESHFIDHVLKTYEQTQGNLGVLLNGTKGTGKTVSAKIIANRLGLPVLLVNAPYPGLADFVSKIGCPCTLVFDEFEKNFDTREKEDVELLSLMDGVFNSPYRRVFLLTTNRLYVNENLLGRPSRIRYRKSFGNLSPEVVKEYLDDNLINKEFTSDIIDFVDTLSISTIDILKSIVEEVNIHNTSVSSFKGFFNVETAKHSYSAFVRWVYNDSDDYSLENFKKDLARVSTKEKDEDGDEITVDHDYLSIYRRRINSNQNVEYLQPGDEFGEYGRVVDVLDLNGCLSCEDEYGRRTFMKILNIDNKPSLYRGGLVY